MRKGLSWRLEFVDLGPSCIGVLEEVVVNGNPCLPLLGGVFFGKDSGYWAHRFAGRAVNAFVRVDI